MLDNLINDVTADMVRQETTFLIECIREHIPGFSMETAADHAGRVSIQIPEGKRYPKRYVLDAGTPGEVVLCELEEPKIEMIGHSATATWHYRRPQTENTE